ncbi:MAG TPA: NAD(P)/FAD-dependent oxidoreductase [Rhizomicrobium sp.]|jgi:phytoene dehydrogenase-like protein
MSGPESNDAIVIGGGTSGLVAAAYLAKTGKKVLLLEAKDKLGGLCAPGNLAEGFKIAAGAQTLYALDPVVVRELKLPKKGLRFASRELALTGLRSDGKHVVISGDVHDTASSIALHSQRDADTWPRFRKELFEMARAMRPLWWESQGAFPTGIEGQKIERLARMSSGAWLDSWFESDAIKATLCFDSTAGGHSVLEPGSALSLVWRAAQEMSGLQGAVAIPRGGLAALTEALIAAAQDAGCEIRSGVEVVRVILDGERAAGVQMRSGETCFAPLVFSAIGSFRLFSRLLLPGTLGIARTEASRRRPSVAQARVVMTLRRVPQISSDAILPASRFILAERLETYVAADLAARNGDLSDELPMEFVIPTTADASLAPPGQHILSARVRPVPRYPAEGWAALSTRLGGQVVASLERLVPGLSRDIAHIEISRPDLLENALPLNVPHMLTTAARRVETPIAGLFLCGADAEPVPAVSGRAARIAVASALAVRR